MAKKICDCFLQVLQWLMMINIFSNDIMSKTNMQYFVLKVKTIKYKNLCSCRKNKEYLQCLQALFTYIYGDSKSCYMLSSSTIKNCLSYIFNGDDKLNGQVTHYQFNAKFCILFRNVYVAHEFALNYYQVDLDSIYIKALAMKKVIYIYENGALRLVGTKFGQMKKGNLHVGFIMDSKKKHF